MHVHICCFKFKIRSQSKASYLTTRHEKDRILPESDTGRYKRTMSPNGHELPSEPISEPQKIKETFCSSHTTRKNTNISRRSSMNEPKIDKCDVEDLKNNLVLPDVLPVNAKLRSLYHATSKLSDTESQIILPKPLSKSPPSSSPKSPSRNCNFTNTFSTITPSTAIITSPRTFSQSPTAISSSLSAFCTPSPTVVQSYSETTVPISRLSISSVDLTTSIRSTAATLPRMNITPSKKSNPSPITPPSYPDRTSPSIAKPVSRSSSLVKKCSLSPRSSLKLSPVKISTTSASSTPVISSSFSSSPVALQLPKSPPLISSTLKENYPQGLQLIQRTEVVLRVNATIDAASQTEKEEWSSTPLSVRKKLKEEDECEKLAEDLIDHLSRSDRLKGLLVTLPGHKKSTDYIQGLFREEITSRPRPLSRSKSNASNSTPPPVFTLSVTTSTTSTVSSATSKLSTSPSSPTTSVTSSFESSPLSSSSTCFVNLEPNSAYPVGYIPERKNCLTVKNTRYLNQKKEELINRLEKKIEVLRTEELIIQDECKINDDLGEDVEKYINMVARPHEAAKFRLHVEEIGKITNLLLSLSSRLAKTENVLMEMSENDLERTILEAKRDKLMDQLQEAKKLKESIDRRGVNVSNILNKYLNSVKYADYDHFINMKTKLLVDSKETSDRIKLGEEQLLALKDANVITD
uniref:Protein Shroom-like isoform X2 n=1 Tax=Diabrotica virgifera virgifera TaxID=50390 RepID=A0A6P7GT44_DIAVI